MSPHLHATTEFLIEWHYLAAYTLAVVFPVVRLVRRKINGHKTALESILHQAATGFIFPAFVMLCFSYSAPDLVKQLSPHELGLAGLFALLTSAREIFVDGVEPQWRSTSFKE